MGRRRCGSLLLALLLAVLLGGETAAATPGCFDCRYYNYGICTAIYRECDFTQFCESNAACGENLLWRGLLQGVQCQAGGTRYADCRNHYETEVCMEFQACHCTVIRLFPVVTECRPGGFSWYTRTIPIGCFGWRPSPGECG